MEELLPGDAGVVEIPSPQKERCCNRKCAASVFHLLLLTVWFGLTIFAIAQHKVAGPLIAADEVGNATWATLPVAITDVGGIVFSVPVSLIVKRIGWRKGFMMGGAVGVVASMICFVGTWFDNYYVLCFGSLFMAVWNVCGYYVRFAAAESVDDRWDTGRVISYVFVSSAITGSFGPQMVSLMNEFVTDYFSVYIEIGGIAAICIAIAICMRHDTPPAKKEQMNSPAPRPVTVVTQEDAMPAQLPLDEDTTHLDDVKVGAGEENVALRALKDDTEDSPRSLCQILRSPVIIVAIISEMVGMYAMLLVMTATPIAMHGAQTNSFHFDLEQTTLTIQIHIVSMFLPGTLGFDALH